MMLDQNSEPYTAAYRSVMERRWTMDIKCLVLGYGKDCFIFPCQLRTCEGDILFHVGRDAVTLAL